MIGLDVFLTDGRYTLCPFRKHPGPLGSGNDDFTLNDKHAWLLMNDGREKRLQWVSWIGD